MGNAIEQAYGYILNGKEIVVHEEKADAVRSTFSINLPLLFRKKILPHRIEKSSSTPASRQVQPWSMLFFFRRVSPAAISRVFPSMVKENRPLTT